jgi:hypothetical protein
MAKVLGIYITGGGGGGTPSDQVTPESSFGGSPNAGSETTYSRGDHTHGAPTDPVPTHAQLATGIHGVGASTVESASGAQAKVNTHKDATTGVHGVTGTIAEVSDIAVDGNLSAYAQDAVTKRHTQNSDTDLDSTFEATFEKNANKGAASGYAPLDAASKVPTANLGGAGADATKYLRGDQTWQVPSGGGGSDGEASVILGSDQTTASTSYADLAGLGFSVLANSTYVIEGWIVWKSSSSAYGIGFGINGPTGQAIAVHTTVIALTTGTGYIQNGSGYNAPNTTSASPPAANTPYLATMHSVLKTGATPGTFQVRWRSENASGTMTALAGSTLRYRKVA